MKRTLLLVGILVLEAASAQTQPSLLTDSWKPSFAGVSTLRHGTAEAGGTALQNAPAARRAAWSDAAAWLSTASAGDRRGASFFGSHLLFTAETLSPATYLEQRGRAGRWLIWFRESSNRKARIDWLGLLNEQTRIDALFHAKRLTEPKTRQELYGTNFVEGYREALRGYAVQPAHWQDGDKFFGNNINHPIMGSIYSEVYTNHDRHCRAISYGEKGYWSCFTRAGIYAAIASVNWEWNPLMSESAIGHVGKARERVNGKWVGEGGWSDFVMTPVGGAGIRLVGDIAQAKLWPVLDRHLSDSKPARILKNVLKVATAPSHSLNRLMNLQFDDILRTPRAHR